MATASLAHPQSVQAFSGVQAEADNEIFDVFDSNEVHLGTQLRSICHRDGLWHRAVYALLLNKRHELLIQKRSAQKKVSPGKWDLSAAEHLQPGEAYLHAAARGLQEELGVTVPSTQDASCSASNGGQAEDTQEQQGDGAPSACLPALWARLKGPLAPRHARCLDIPEIDIKDYEFVETYSMEGYDGPLMYNSEEVSEVAWVTIPDVAQRMKDNPDDFTPWFLHEARMMGWLDS